MDYTSIFNSDFFVATLLEIISPIELYHLRYVTKYIYTNLTIKNIKNKIISNVKNRLQYELGDNYNTFINIIKNRNICIYGPIVTEAIWDEYHNSTYIDIRMFDTDMGSLNDNVFIDLNKIKPNLQMSLYEFFNNWFRYESDTSTIIDKIRLFVVSDYHISDVYETFPGVFQNKITIDDNWSLIIKDVEAVTSKTLGNLDYYRSCEFEKQETEEYLCNKYTIF